MSRDDGFERDLGDALRGRPASSCPGEPALLEFYRGRLSEGESEVIRAHLPACNECLRAAQDALAFLEAMEGAPERSRRPGPGWLAVAAALLVAAVGLWASRHRPAAPAPVESPAASARKPPNPWRDLPVQAAAYRPEDPEDELVFRSEKKPADDGFPAAMDPYTRGDYAAADAELERFLAAHPGHAGARFFRGVSLLMLGKPREARALLESGAAPARAPAEAPWYAALALLKSGDEAGALAELDAVGRAAGPHRAEAAELAEAVRRGRDAR